MTDICSIMHYCTYRTEKPVRTTLVVVGGGLGTNVEEKEKWNRQGRGNRKEK
jgi:hypothetical protein